MQIKQKIINKFSIKEVKKFIIIFYIVGLTGIAVPFTRNFFFILTPVALFFNFFLLLIYQEDKLKLKHIVLFSVIFVLGFFIEFVGVKTGKIFGIYWYGNGLGLKIAEIPIIIGMNWLLLVYLTYNILRPIKNRFVRVLPAAFLMVFYDFFVEQVAGFMDMWYWHKEYVPIQNYLAWLFFSIIFLFLFAVADLKINNKLSFIVFSVQFLFFTLVLLI